MRVAGAPSDNHSGSQPSRPMELLTAPNSQSLVASEAGTSVSAIA